MLRAAMRWWGRKAALGILASGVLSGVFPGAVAAETPSGVGGIPDSGPAAEAAARIQIVFDEIAAITADETADPNAKRAALEHEISPLLDYPMLARSALGPLAQRFSREEYGEFSHEYARYVTDTLVRRFAAYPGKAGRVDSASYDAERHLVHVVARGVATTSGHPALQRLRKLEPIRLELVLRERYGEWRIAGVTRGDVDVSRSFREQFAAVIERSDPAALIEQLRVKNREAEASNPFAEE
jgi:ABC-type transporter MlaC component